VVFVVRQIKLHKGFSMQSSLILIYVLRILGGLMFIGGLPLLVGGVFVGREDTASVGAALFFGSLILVSVSFGLSTLVAIEKNTRR